MSSVDPARAKALFDEVIELEEHERETVLREHCGDDEALRRGVERLLRADRRTGFLESPSPRPGSTAIPPSPSARRDRVRRTLLLGGAVAVTAVLVIGLIGLPGQLRRSGPSPRPGPRPLGAADLTRLSETFDDRTPDPRFIASVPSATERRNGRLVLKRVDDDATRYAYRLDPAQAQVHGDVDVTVDFDLEMFPVPPRGYHEAVLALIDPASGADLAVVGRHVERDGPDCLGAASVYKAGRGDPGSPCEATRYVPADDRRGRLRIARRGSEATLYRWSDGDWVAMHRMTVGAFPIGLEIRSGGRPRPPGRVAFDQLFVQDP